jgi:hypothetical protein
MVKAKLKRQFQYRTTRASDSAHTSDNALSQDSAIDEEA